MSCPRRVCFVGSEIRGERYCISCGSLELGGCHLDVAISGDQCRRGSISRPWSKKTGILVIHNGCNSE